MAGYNITGNLFNFLIVSSKFYWNSFLNKMYVTWKSFLYLHILFDHVTKQPWHNIYLFIWIQLLYFYGYYLVVSAEFELLHF